MDPCNIAIPVPRQRYPHLSSANCHIGKRGPCDQLIDSGVMKELKPVSDPQFQSLQHLMINFLTQKVPNPSFLQSGFQNPPKSQKTALTRDTAKIAAPAYHSEEKQSQNTAVSTRRRHNMLEIIQSFKRERTRSQQKNYTIASITSEKPQTLKEEF